MMYSRRLALLLLALALAGPGAGLRADEADAGAGPPPAAGPADQAPGNTDAGGAANGAVDPIADSGGAPADAAADAAALPAPAPSPPDPAALREAAQARYLRLMDEDRAAEAVPAAREVVDLTRQLAGDGTLALARPLTNLATAQARAGDLPAAEGNYRDAIALIERHEGILSPRLGNALNGLGDTYLRAGQYEQAVAAFQRALGVSQVNEGLYNPGQYPIRDALSESFLGTEDLEQATFHQKFQVMAEGRRLGGDSPALADALYKLGAWYQRTGQPEDARLVYQRLDRILEDGLGDDAPARADAALAIARTFKQQALAPASANAEESPLAYLPLAATHLRRALEIDKRQPVPDPARRGRILVELGDVYLLLNRRNAALENYSAAWSVLAGREDLVEQRGEYFGDPVLVAGPDWPAVHPRKARRNPRSAREPGFVLVRYAVDERGLVEEAAIVEADPVGLIDDAVLAALRGSLYRPRFEAGQPVRAGNLLRRHAYRYRSDREEPVPPPEAPDRPLAEP